MTGCRHGPSSRPGTPSAPAPTCLRCPYYEALALFKLAIILEGAVARLPAAAAAERAAMNDRLIHYAGLFARGERDLEAAR